MYDGRHTSAWSPLRRLRSSAWGIAAAACLAAGAAVVAQDETTGAISPEIDGILTKLEKRSDGLKDIQCKIRFEEVDQINLGKIVKIGSVRLMVTDTNPRALVHFKRCEIEGVLRKQEWYLFDGRFWHEAIERLEQVTKREIVRAAEAFDLFDLETSPFPMPLGQKKATILRNFDVALIAPAGNDPDNTDHLRLTPIKGSRLDEKYTTIDYYVRKDIHLPSRIVVARNEGYEIVTVDFLDLSETSFNTGLSDKDFKPPKAWRNFAVVEEPLAPAP